MKIFWNKKTGEIIGTVDGFDQSHDGISITPAGIPLEDIGEETIVPGHPKEALARKLMDPRDELGIHLLKVEGDGIAEMNSGEKKAVKARIRKQEEESRRRQEEVASRPSLQEQMDEIRAMVEALLAAQNK